MIQARSVGEMLRVRARLHPERPFLWCGNERLTYAEADARASSVAAGLAEAGIGPGDRVAVISSNRTEMLDLFFALARIGAVNVPLNVFLKGEFLRYQLDDSESSTLIADASGLQTAAEVLEDLPSLKRIVALDDAPGLSGIEVVPYARVRAATGAPPSVDLEPASLMSIMYTSGTTGMPKGCILPHGWYLTTPASSKHMMGYTDGDVLCTALPLFHAWAQGMVMGALYNGLEAVIEPVFSTADVVQRWAETGATVYAGVGMMAMALLGLPASSSDRSHRLRATLMMPMTPSDQATFEQRFGVTVLSQMYGQTECGAIAYCALDEQRKPGTLGKPSPFYEVRLVNDDDVEVPVGELGEIVVRPRAPHGMYQGYWRKPEATLEAWRNLWHHTGDTARADEDGFLTFVDRKKDALRRRGENVSSIELEVAITRHPAIAEAAVHAIPSPMTEDDIKTCVVLVGGATVEPAELFEFFRTSLPYFAIPRYVEVVPELPRNATMRVMKHLLRARGVTAETWDLEAMGFSVAPDERR
ncbi:MAG TPA: AMP-binding protein [Actinomycetota bacterium]